MSMLEQNQENEEWIKVGTYDSLNKAYDHSLVPLSMGESVRIEEGNKAGHFDLLAEAVVASSITKELEEYTEECFQKKALKANPSGRAKHSAGLIYILIWASTLLYVFKQQAVDPTIANRFATSSIGLMEDGEWWRSFTALFLHGDGPHMVGNIATGTIFGILVAKTLGPLKGWLLILLSGTLGNLATSWLTYPEHFASLGASTAVFGALGILSGSGLIENLREDIRLPRVRLIAPLFAGQILLGWLGGAAPDTGIDVLGHVFGFCVGIICGFLASMRQHNQIVS